MRQGNYGNSLSSVQMIVQAFSAFVKAADAVEVKVSEFMSTADRMMKDPQLDSRRIRHEVDETERRWRTFYNSIKNYSAALADSAKFFDNWHAVSLTIVYSTPHYCIADHTMTFLHLPQLKLVLNLLTTEGCKAVFTWVVVIFQDSLPAKCGHLFQK